MPTLNWIGKEKIINHHQDVPYRILEKQYTFSNGNEDNTTSSENKIIHGDNLEALKSLLPEYEGRIKCIYIDPPYNTGNEGWVYNDNVNDPKLKKWLGKVVGKESEDLSRNDKWLCMMYPRLKLLHRLLSNEGFIFVSIDYYSNHLLKSILNEIFGSNNFRNCIAVRRGIKNVQAQFEKISSLSVGHEYIYLYSKSTNSKLPKLNKSLFEKKDGKWDTFWRGTNRPTMRYSLLGNNPSKGQWRWKESRAIIAVNNYKIYLEKYSESISLDDYYLENLMATNEKTDFVRKNEEGVIQYYVPPQGFKLLSDNWMDILLSGSYTNFDTEKNVLILDRIFSWVLGDDLNSIGLDSFAGSGTTAHAILNLNKKDGGNRKFILIEMENYASSLTTERVKQVIKGYEKGKKIVKGTGGNFSYYELGQSMFLQDELLNEEIGKERIEEYVWYSETKTLFEPQTENYLLGTQNDTAYYFYYEKDRLTTLNESYLRTLQTKASQYIIYADLCLLDKALMDKYHIVFKKIPRDITRF